MYFTLTSVIIRLCIKMYLYLFAATTAITKYTTYISSLLAYQMSCNSSNINTEIKK